MSDWRPRTRSEAFKLASIKRRISGADLARILGVSRQLVSGVITGRSRSGKVEAKIAEVFPEVVEAFPFRFADHDAGIVAGGTRHGNCTPDQLRAPHQPAESPAPAAGQIGRGQSPGGETPEDPMVTRRRDLTPRQREMLAQVRHAGGRARVRDLPGWAPHAATRVAQGLVHAGVVELGEGGQCVMPESDLVLTGEAAA